MLTFDRQAYFDAIRPSPFGGSMSQSQVDGQNAILAAWEKNPTSDDLRFLAYALATTYHETAATMQPIEEYGKGSGMEYGETDPETGQTYYGRGYVQLTWRDNYARATEKLSLTATVNDLEWHAARALDPTIASEVMFRGMTEGWFTGKKLGDYFSASKDDPVNARAIINADVSKNGQMVAGYHESFLAALDVSAGTGEETGRKTHERTVVVAILADEGVTVRVTVNGEAV